MNPQNKKIVYAVLITIAISIFIGYMITDNFLKKKTGKGVQDWKKAGKNDVVTPAPSTPAPANG